MALGFLRGLKSVQRETSDTAVFSMAGTALLDLLAALDDPRQSNKVVYCLPEVTGLALCATLIDAKDFVEVRLRGQEKQAFLR